MANWFVIIIYLASISLGLPDSLLGAAWPTMRLDLNMQLGAAGIISMIISAGTIVSSINSGKLITGIGTGKIVLVSCMITAVSLLGFSQSPSFIWLVFLAIPLGLGGGAVDSALNHYVADNYQAHHMSWFHSFWGVGATAGPLIMAFSISYRSSWREGYLAVSTIQFLLVLILFAALPMWKKIAEIRKEKQSKNNGDDAENGIQMAENVLRMKGVKYSLTAFLLYCAVETTVGLWGASYLVGSRGMAEEAAAGWISLYYGGITIGRMITGFITMKIDNRHLILYGQILSVVGGLLLLLPVPISFAQIGLVLIGIGLAPIFPGLLHETPRRFGKANSAKLMGYQMAAAYTGTTFLPPIFGLIATKGGIDLFPGAVFILLVIMLLISERVNTVIAK